MNPIKVMTVFGTRPEAIKMAPLVKKLQENPDIECIVCVTAQHREMLDQVLELFEIKPQYDLDIMKQRQTLADITTKALIGLSQVMEEVKPDLVLVHGDTSTTFVASLAAFYRQIRIGHVEAGLRTFDKYFPFPEEMNRKLTGCLADYHYAPTRRNKENLLREGVSEKRIYITGNTVVDALKIWVDKEYAFTNPAIREIDFKARRVITVTAHRRENLGKPLEQICRAIRRIADHFDDVEVVYPVHLNPVVQDTARRILGGHSRIRLIDPIDFQEMYNLMDRSYLIITDSGGLQEEAPALGKPVLVLRNETERPEAIEAGTARLAGTSEEKIFEMASALLENEAEYLKMAHAVNPFGDGHASERIVEAILYDFGKSNTPPDEFK